MSHARSNAGTRLLRSADGCAVAVRSPLFRRARIVACGASLVVLTTFAAQADAAICKYQGRDGRITYSNLASGPPGASKIECFAAPAPVSPTPAARSAANAAPAMADAEDRNALEQQLADEEEQLEDAQRALSEREASLGQDEMPYYDDALGPLVDIVTEHRRQRDRIRHKLAERGWDREPSHGPRAGMPLTQPSGAVGSRPDLIPRAPVLGNGGGGLERHPVAGPGQQRDGGTGSREEGELGRR